MTAAVAPNIEERLVAAAFQILTDENRHSHQAQTWAVRFIRRAARGRQTEFQRRLHVRGQVQ
jgi:hypothetical protein